MIFSHSSARAVTDHVRNVPDDVLATLAGNGGVCMVTFVPRVRLEPTAASGTPRCWPSMDERGENRRDWDAHMAAAARRAPADPAPVATIAQVADHVEHVRAVAGIEHVGLGGDFDGCDPMPAGLADVAGYPALVDELLARGWSGSPTSRRWRTPTSLRVLHDAEQWRASTSWCMARLDFYFDPVCPFAWMTSKWVRMVAAQRDYTVDWRFISLRMINAHVDYDAHFPPGYEAGHTAGLRLLRVAARDPRRARAGRGRRRSTRRCGARIFDAAVRPADGRAGHRGTPRVRRAGPGRGRPADRAGRRPGRRDAWDAEIRAETDEALALTGKDVGTPIIHFEPPDGVAFFGPVISRLPTDDEAVELWDHVVGLAGFPRLRRAQAQPARAPAAARASASSPARSGSQEDWHGGSRRTT